MTVLTQEMLAHAYDYLCEWPPFNKWNMRPSEDVQFGIIKRRDRYAHFCTIGGEPCIEVSARFVGTHIMLLATLAHEMVHMHAHSTKQLGGDPHGKAFQKWADKICSVHGFDRLNF